MILTAISGRQYTVGPECGRGGEGVVHEVANDPSLVVKLYHQRADDVKRRKVALMVKAYTPSLIKHTSWPVDVADGNNYAVVMPKMGGREIHDVYGVKSRLLQFPKAKYKFLMTVAYNLCAALDEIHSVGAVVGDFNERNIVVSPDGSVKFLDCDSFQIKAPNGELFGCEVGVPIYLAPELQGNVVSTVRTPNQDNFTLAVFIFQLLFLGRHPFQGIGGPVELGESIKRHLYAYGKGGKNAGIRLPEYVLKVETIAPALVDLFERAFEPNAVRGSRPNAATWGAALRIMRDQLIQCNVNSSHEYYPGDGRKCPFCALYVKFQASYFNVDSQHPFHIEALTFGELINKLILWQPPDLGVPGESHFKFPSLQPRSFPAELAEAKGGFFVAVGNWLKSSDRINARISMRNTLENELRIAVSRLQEWLGGVSEINSRYRKQIAEAKVALRLNWSKYQDLPSERKRMSDALFKEFEKIQRDQFLDTHYIARANLQGFGRVRIASLNASGIETALDITPSMQISGIGPGLTAQLVVWRNQVVQKFVFNPRQQMDPKELQKIDVALTSRKFDLEKYFKHFEVHLRDIHRANDSLVQSATPAFTQLAKAKAQAKLNLDTFNQLYPV